jgi:hypothetical protein
MTIPDPGVDRRAAAAGEKIVTEIDRQRLRNENKMRRRMRSTK